MNWAARRRFMIALIVGAVVVAFTAVVLIATLYETPSCTDGVQNQNEAGIDCGGPCAYLCTADMQTPVVLYTKVLQNADGRTDIIASVENKNIDAATENVPYRLKLYGSGQVFLQEITGAIDLPPRTTALLYLPGVAVGKQEVVNAFLYVDASALRWFAIDPSTLLAPIVSNVAQSGTKDRPRVKSTLENPSIRSLTNTAVIVVVRDENGNVIAASRTFVPIIPAQGEAEAIFTWNNAFSSTPATIEVTPVISLP